ncbi:MAG: rhomboid family intramembrane serine protease [Bacteroidales bacterium]
MTLIIIIITAIISLLALNDRSLMHRLQFNAYRVRHNNEIYRFFTYGFVHADWVHLAVNLFVLYSFGEAVDFFYGGVFNEKASFYFILLYSGGILFSTLPSYLKQKDNPYYNAVGASGAVSAIVFTSILFNPGGRIGFLFLPFDIPAIIFGVLYLIYSAYMAKRGQDNIGHDAHFWGAIFGIVFTLAIKPSLGSVFLAKVMDMIG